MYVCVCVAREILVGPDNAKFLILPVEKGVHYVVRDRVQKKKCIGDQDQVQAYSSPPPKSIPNLTL